MGAGCRKPKQPPEPTPGEKPVEPVRRSSFDDLNLDKSVLEDFNMYLTSVDVPSVVGAISRQDLNEEEWLPVVTSMIKVIPLDNQGPAFITAVLECLQMPTKDTLQTLFKLFDVPDVDTRQSNPKKHRNLCVVLAFVAEKLTGPKGVSFLSGGTLEYLISNLNEAMDPNIILFSLIALEKFAVFSKNKSLIRKRLQQEKTDPLLVLSQWHQSEDPEYLKRQVGFCALWCVNNLTKSAILFNPEACKHVKLSPDGLEARYDNFTFKTVRCSIEVDEKAWFYEVLIITPGRMQIGWATKCSTFLHHEGSYGVGDDTYSVSYDGGRCVLWYDAKFIKQEQTPWKPGDIIGCLLDLDVLKIKFFINGNALPCFTEVFNVTKSGFFAAVSFTPFQQCRFNFGSTPFVYPPRIDFQTFHNRN